MVKLLKMKDKVQNAPCWPLVDPKKILLTWDLDEVKNIGIKLDKLAP